MHPRTSFLLVLALVLSPSIAQAFPFAMYSVTTSAMPLLIGALSLFRRKRVAITLLFCLFFAHVIMSLSPSEDFHFPDTLYENTLSKHYFSQISIPPLREFNPALSLGEGPFPWETLYEIPTHRMLYGMGPSEAAAQAPEGRILIGYNHYLVETYAQIQKKPYTTMSPLDMAIKEGLSIKNNNQRSPYSEPSLGAMLTADNVLLLQDGGKVIENGYGFSQYDHVTSLVDFMQKGLPPKAHKTINVFMDLRYVSDRDIELLAKSLRLHSEKHGLHINSIRDFESKSAHSSLYKKKANEDTAFDPDRNTKDPAHQYQGIQSVFQEIVSPVLKPYPRVNIVEYETLRYYCSFANTQVILVSPFGTPERAYRGIESKLGCDNVLTWSADSVLPRAGMAESIEQALKEVPDEAVLVFAAFNKTTSHIASIGQTLLPDRKFIGLHLTDTPGSASQSVGLSNKAYFLANYYQGVTGTLILVALIVSFVLLCLYVRSTTRAAILILFLHACCFMAFQYLCLAIDTDARHLLLATVLFYCLGFALPLSSDQNKDKAYGLRLLTRAGLCVPAFRRIKSPLKNIDSDLRGKILRSSSSYECTSFSNSGVGSSQVVHDGFSLSDANALWELSALTGRPGLIAQEFIEGSSSGVALIGAHLGSSLGVVIEYSDRACDITDGKGVSQRITKTLHECEISASALLVDCYKIAEFIKGPCLCEFVISKDDIYWVQLQDIQISESLVKSLYEIDRPGLIGMGPALQKTSWEIERALNIHEVKRIGSNYYRNEGPYQALFYSVATSLPRAMTRALLALALILLRARRLLRPAFFLKAAYRIAKASLIRHQNNAGQRPCAQSDHLYRLSQEVIVNISDALKHKNKPSSRSTDSLEALVLQQSTDIDTVKQVDIDSYMQASNATKAAQSDCYLLLKEQSLSLLESKPRVAGFVIPADSPAHSHFCMRARAIGYDIIQGSSSHE